MSTVTSAEFWNAETDVFDEQPDHVLSDPSVRAAWSGLLLPLLPAPPARIADVGCGTRSVSLLLAEAGHRVFGLDISPAMVGRATEKFATWGTRRTSSWGMRAFRRGHLDRSMWSSLVTSFGLCPTRMRH